MSHAAGAGSVLTVRDWGTREYRSSLDEMRRLVRARVDGTISDTLILVEHPSVVTVGIEGDDGSAASSGFPVVPVERGGRATYHGPGQLVAYPIVALDRRGRDVRRFVGDVEELVIRTVRPFGLTGQHVQGRRGVWIDGERKIASVGIAIDHWVTLHGLALNVDPDLSAFRRINPCGFDGAVMTSIARELGRPVSVDEAKPHLLAAWESVFGSDTALSVEGPRPLVASPVDP